MSDLNDDPRLYAEENGLRVVLPADDELFVDIDDNERMAQVLAALATMTGNEFPCHISSIKLSKTPGHSHVIVKFPGMTFTPLERVCLQAAFGSDPKRELLAWIRIKNQYDRPASLFFEVNDDAS